MIWRIGTPLSRSYRYDQGFDNHSAPDRKSDSGAGGSRRGQAIGSLFNDIFEQAKKDVVLAEGHSLAGEEVLYVMRGEKAEAEAEVDALIAADPGATAGVSAPKAFGWKVIAMKSSR